ncbi:MAG: NAD-dependent epimerase/dehydratase family protein [Lentisphaeria bacterium]|nr:NAD-dependent epimerase/dehydratase family protein [Lentisphaeria bacterium]
MDREQPVAGGPGHAWVTGGTGFIGGWLVERLIEAGWEVTCLVRAGSRTARLEALGVRLVTGCLEAPPPCAVSGEAVDAFFHVAGVTRARSAAEYARANARTTEILFRGLGESPTPPRRTVLVSSLAAVGPTPAGVAPPDESVAPKPLPGYGASKREAETAALAWAEVLPLTIVRPPAVYGPHDRNFLPLFRVAARTGLFPVLGWGRKCLAMVHVDDLVTGLLLAAGTPAAAGRTYFISGGNYGVDAVAEALGRALGRRLRVLRIPSPLARLAGEAGEILWSLTGRTRIVCRRKVTDMLQPNWTCVFDRAGAELGYRPRIDLATGFRQTALWYREQGWL